MFNYNNRIQTLSSWYSTAVIIVMGMCALSNYILIIPFMNSSNSSLSIPNLSTSSVKL